MKIFRLILAEVIFIISFLLFTEFIGRAYFYFKHGYTFKESFLYENDEQLIYRINSSYKGPYGRYYCGIRKDYFKKDKGNKIRIVCLGESTTQGHSQHDNSKTWPEILERLLGKEKYEVLNAGVAGYGSSNIAVRLKKDILRLDPDIAIIFLGWNLAGSLKSKYAFIPDNVYFKKQPFLKILNSFFIGNSIVYLKLCNLIRQQTKMFDNNKMIHREIIDKIYKKELPLIEKDLEEIITVCRENNIRPIIIKYPTLDYDYQRYKDTIHLIEDIARKNSVYLINCSYYFESLERYDRAAYFTDIAHFSDKGNEKIAEMIYYGLLRF